MGAACWQPQRSSSALASNLSTLRFVLQSDWHLGSLKNELKKSEGRCSVMGWLLLPTEDSGPLCRDEAE